LPDTTIKQGTKPLGYIRTSDEVEIIDYKGELISVGREGSLTGNRVDCFILDDLYKDAMEAQSPVVRENCWEWYTSVVRTRMHNASQEIIVFTRWHEDDLIGVLRRKEGCVDMRDWADIDRLGTDDWLCLNFEAIKTGEPTEIDPRKVGEALWPERQSVELLEAKRRLDTLRFECMYQGRPSSPGGLLYGDGFGEYDSLPREIVTRSNYTDTADMGDDYLCSMSYAVDADGVVYVTDVVYSREPMETTEQLVADMLMASATPRALIESNNGGRGFARAVQKLAPRVKVEWFHQSGNKEARIFSNSATALHTLRMPKDWHLRWPEFYAHLTTFKRLFKANVHDDAADAITGIVEREVSSSERKLQRIKFI
jgi:predicted phage terminase large subunit-like protein